MASGHESFLSEISMQNFFLNNYSGRSDETIVRPFSCRIVP